MIQGKINSRAIGVVFYLLKLTFIARALKLSREGFYKKLNNQTEFKASEIVKMQEILNLSNEQRDKIFFAN